MLTLNTLFSSADSTSGILLLKITLGAFIAFAMEISEFLVLSHTSSLTLSVAGIFKVRLSNNSLSVNITYITFVCSSQEIFQLVLAVVWNGDQLSVTNLIGLTLCLGGICCHVVHKFTSGKDSLQHRASEDSVDDFGGSRRLESNNSTHSYNSNNNKPQIKLNHFSKQSLPLLESTDEHTYSDSDHSQYEIQNASEVIFDVLKRRDFS